MSLKGNQSWIFIGRMLKLQYFGHLMQRTDSLEKPWCWARLKAGEEGDDRGWDGWMASLTWWTEVWVSSGSWWWTGKVAKSQTWLSDWKELNLLLRQGTTGVRHRLHWGKEGRDQIFISFSHFILLFIKPALTASCVFDTVFSSLSIIWRSWVICPRSASLKEWAVDITENFSGWWRTVPGLSLLDLSHHCQGFLLEILGRA